MAGKELPDTETLRGYELDQLTELEGELVEEFNALYGDDGSEVDEAGYERLGALADKIGEIRGLKAEAEATAETRSAGLAALKDQVAGVDPQDDEGDGEGGDEESTEIDSDALAAIVSAAVSATLSKTIPAENLVPAQTTGLNQRMRLGQMRQFAPDAKVPAARNEPVVVASADVPGFVQGGQLLGMEELGRAMHARSRSLPVTRNGQGNWVPVASLNREFNFKVEGTPTLEKWNEVLKAATDPDILTAAGGWCAPSEISYDFFNVVCEDGMFDLPSIGVMSRGGIQFPQSPTFADIIADDNSLFTWTEQDDIDALETDGPTKPCARIPCPEFDEERLQCDGFCLTVGNLVDFAFPELVANHLRLLFAARAHVTNFNIIQMVLNGIDFNVDHTGMPGSTTAQLLNSVELTAVDYREKFRMCEDAPIEVVLPRWAWGPIRADMANRTGMALFDVTNAMVADWFDLRGVRVQLIADWQNNVIGDGAAPATLWPATIQYMAYAPGTFVRGSGLSLDLGVVRDSVLNETNDHTAAWMEECYLVAKPGNEARLVTTSICTAGNTGDTDVVCETGQGS